MAKKTSAPFLQLLSVLVVCVILAVGLWFAYHSVRRSTEDRSKADSLADQYVTKNGTKFFLGGKPFTFVGFNLFDAANTYFPDQNKKGYSCPRDSGWWTNIYTEADLDSTFAYAKTNAGASVIRFWAFQKYTNGGTDWSGIDKVIRVARKNGMKVIPVLDDGAGYCTYPEPSGNAKYKYNGDTWYSAGYKLKMGSYPLTYPEYVKAIVTRYKDEPTILGWMMMNEADTSMKTQPDGSIVKDGSGPTVLVNFAKDIGGIIKSIDQNHLVTVGTQSNGASGATGRDFISLYSLPVVDFAEVHDWGYWGNPDPTKHDFAAGEKNPLPGSADGISLPNPDSTNCQAFWQNAQIGCSFAMSILKLNKPIIVGESGISSKRFSLADRAKLMDAKMNAFFQNGGAGYLVWQLNKVVDTEGFDVLTTTNDPLFAVMKKYAGATVIPTQIPVATPYPTVAATVIPTLRPTIQPTIVPTIRPTSVPTAKPTSAPIAKPTATPVAGGPSVQGTVIQGESFSRDGVTARTIADTVAYNGQALQLLGRTTVKSTIAGPIKKLTIRARSVACAGYGHIIIKVNGTYVFDGNISSSSYTNFVTSDLSYIGLRAQSYPIEVTYNSPYTTSTCTRSVVIDQITIGQ